MIPRFKFIKANRISCIETLGGISWNAIKSHLSTWKDGTAGYMELHKESKPKSPEQLGYYYAVIIPAAVEAFKENQDFSLTLNFKGKKIEVELTPNNMDNFLKLRYAEAGNELKNKAEMTMAECSAFIDWAIKWCATWLNIQIPPADPDWDKNE